jgi:5-formyltetrahydrofolate cyclo-ligase
VDPAPAPEPARPGPQGKAALRTVQLARRRALGPAERDATARAAVSALLGLAGDGPVAAYVSVGSEPGTGPLLAALRGRTRVLLPVLLSDGDLDWAADDGRLVPAGRGLREPAGPRLGPAAVARCGLVVVPALAVDRAGARLGRGAGCYDRALARATGLVVALLHDGELVERVPAEPHDLPVDAVVTPATGLLRLPSPRGEEGPPAALPDRAGGMSA